MSNALKRKVPTPSNALSRDEDFIFMNAEAHKPVFSLFVIAIKTPKGRYSCVL